MTFKVTPPMTMTVYQIEMLLHFHCTPAPWRNTECESYRQGMQFLKQQNLIQPYNGDDDKGWETTPRGYAHVMALKSVPLPIAITKWETPK